MADAVTHAPRLPVGSVGRHALGWWGVLCVIMTEGALFVFLLYSYYYNAALLGAEWFPTELPKFKLSGPNTVLLLLSSVALRWGELSIKKGGQGRLALGLAVAIVLGAAFVGIQWIEWMEKPFSYDTDSYGSVFFTVTGFHMAHVVGGLIVLVVMLMWTLAGTFDRERHAAITIGGAYWHFVDVVWLAIFFTFYVIPYLR
jgi:cytochrome c oxidase subunit III